MRGALFLLLLLACAHAPPPHEVEVVEPRAEAGENQTAPVRKSCKGRGPRIPDGETVTGVVRALYLIGSDGKVSDVSVTGKASSGALKAIQRYIASCTYAPALRDGKPVAVRWRGELQFPATR
jgi:Gram-negative bacterial TonB protein C-terminal